MSGLRRSITVGITGGSGAVYAVRLLPILARHYERVDVVMSNAARQVLAAEVAIEAPPSGRWDLAGDSLRARGQHDPADEASTRDQSVARESHDGSLEDAGALAGTITVWDNQNYRAPFASGSNCADQMVIIPCSMSTVASIAHGIDQNLLHHAAGVTLKERRHLIVVPRETPLSAIHLRNMLTLAELGVSVVAAMPGFYGGEQTFDDLVDFVLQKVINQLGIDVRLRGRWGEK